MKFEKFQPTDIGSPPFILESTTQTNMLLPANLPGLPSLKQTARLHLKFDGWKMKFIHFLWGWPISQVRTVCYREGRVSSKSLLKSPPAKDSELPYGQVALNDVVPRNKCPGDPGRQLSVNQGKTKTPKVGNTTEPTSFFGLFLPHGPLVNRNHPSIG